MKLDCEVTKVSGDGETMTIGLSGRQANDAEWRRDGYQEVQITASGSAKRAFYLGRRVTLSILPR